MLNDATAIDCPACKKPLDTIPISEELVACALCSRRVRTDGRYHEAIALATDEEGWIEKIFWKEETENALVNFVMVLFIQIPLNIVKFVGPFLVFVSIALVPQFGWRNWLLIPLGWMAAFAILWAFKKSIESFFPNQFVDVVYFVVSSRGLIVVAKFARPLYLPWTCILRWHWFSHVGSMTSHVTIEYATAGGQVAKIVLEGEERVQPLGELVDILNDAIGPRSQ